MEKTLRRSTLQGNGWNAKWAWIADGENHRISHVWARSVIPPLVGNGSSTLRISASHRYRLWIDGASIGEGPDRADPRFPYFDEYEFPADGTEHVVVALVYHFQADREPLARNWCLNDGPPGIIAEVASAPVEWTMRRSRAFAHEAPLFSIFRGPCQDVDPGLYGMEFAEVVSGGGNWEKSVEFDFGSGRFYPEPMPNESPRLRSRERLPVTVRRALSHLGDLKNHRAFFGFAPEQPMTLNPNEGAAWIECGFGVPYCGFPLLEMEGEGEVDVFYGEGGTLLRQEKLKLRAGQPCRYLGMDWRGGNIVALDCSRITAPLVIRKIAIVDQIYPFRETGKFHCDSTELTKLWQISKTTTWAGVRDHPYDCAREQALWLEDMAIHLKAARACFGDMAPFRKAFVQTLRLISEEGMVPVPGPAGLGYDAKNPTLRWSLCPLALPEILHDLFAWQPDRELAAWGLERFQKMFSFYKGYEDKRGLLQFDPEGKQSLQRFGGWNYSIHEGTNAGTNALYALAFEHAAAVARHIDRPDLAQEWENTNERIVAAIRKFFWRPDRSLFIDGEIQGAPVEAVSPTVNAWCAMAGTLPPNEVGNWSRQLKKDPGILPFMSPYDATLLLCAFARLDLEEETSALLGNYFGSIVRAGHSTLPEFWRSDAGTSTGLGNDTSICHPYGAGPAFVLQEYMLGVKSKEPGWKTIEVRPRSFGLWHACGRVPSPLGAISVEWERTDHSWVLEIDVPKGMAAEIELPRLGIETQRLEVDGDTVAKVDSWEEFFPMAMRDPSVSRTTVLRCVVGDGCHRIITGTAL